MSDQTIRALVVRGNLSPTELLEIIKFVQQVHDRRPDADAMFEILAVDPTATKDGSIETMSGLQGFDFSFYPNHPN